MHPILVIGATGKTGSRVASKLQALGHAVRLGSRNAPIPFDWEAPETWAAALSGVRAAYVTYFPDLAFPGAVDKLDALCRTARAAGVEHLVLLSGRGEHHARLGEEVVRNSGPDFTIVRAAWFAQNFSEGYLREPVLAGVLPMPGGDVVEPIIDVDDIADVVVAALTEGGHEGELYEVTGPRLMSFAEMAGDRLPSRNFTPTWPAPGAISSPMSLPPSRARHWTGATPASGTACNGLLAGRRGISRTLHGPRP